MTTFTSPSDGTPLALHSWGTELENPRGIVQLAHGLAEHGARYARLGQALATASYRVYAVDHRGHGRSVGATEELGTFDFSALTSDMSALGAQLRADTPDLPLFLLSHSMGSFAAQSVILEHSNLYAGVVLSGSTALDVLGAELAQAEGPVGLEAFNLAFEHRTGYEWLSRDEAEVDAYVADPLCGFDLPDSAVPQLFAQAEQLADPAHLDRIRKSLPILVAAGDADPISGGGALVQLLGERYRNAGIADVTVTLYPGARHEIFNEINRDAVTADVISWLDSHC